MNHNDTARESMMADIGKLVLRLGFGGFMLKHGYPKLMKFFADEPIKFPDPLHVGTIPSLSLTVFSEVVCAVLIVIGFKTRWASIPLIITMLVAAFIVHASDPIGKKEFALLYAFGFAAIALLGAGEYSIDRK